MIEEFEKIDQALDSDERTRRARYRRSKGLERFILALSDQQLVTGLAVLIAGFFNPCSRSVFHFNIIAALGWFSSTCHLSTLSVLRTYLMDHPRVRDWRVVGMICVFLLTAVAQTLSFTTQDSAAPIYCAFQHLFPKAVNVSAISLPLIIIFLVVSYSNRIGRLYSLDPDWGIEDWCAELIADLVRDWTDMAQIQHILISMPKRSKAAKGAVFRRVEQRKDFARQCRRWIAHPRGFRRQIYSLRYFYSQLNDSFLGEILTLLFGVTYGITSVVMSRVQVPDVGLSAGQNSMSFGQLVPLLLMLLPCLAAGEVFFGKCQECKMTLSLNIVIPERHDYQMPYRPFCKMKMDTPFDDFAGAIRKTLEQPETKVSKTSYNTQYVFTHSVGPVDNLSQSSPRVDDTQIHNRTGNPMFLSKERLDGPLFEVEEKAKQSPTRTDIETGLNVSGIEHGPNTAAGRRGTYDCTVIRSSSPVQNRQRQVADLFLRENDLRPPSTWGYVLFSLTSNVSLNLFLGIVLGGLSNRMGYPGLFLVLVYPAFTICISIAEFGGTVARAGRSRDRTGSRNGESFAQMLLCAGHVKNL